MKRFLRFLGHIGILGLNAVALYAGFVPGKFAPLAVAVQGLAHAALDLVNRKGN